MDNNNIGKGCNDYNYSDDGNAHRNGNGDNYCLRKISDNEFPGSLSLIISDDQTMFVILQTFQSYLQTNLCFYFHFCQFTAPWAHIYRLVTRL